MSILIVGSLVVCVVLILVVWFVLRARASAGLPDPRDSRGSEESAEEPMTPFRSWGRGGRG